VVGRSLFFEANTSPKSRFNGNLLVTARHYTPYLNLKPGDEFRDQGLGKKRSGWIPCSVRVSTGRRMRRLRGSSVTADVKASTCELVRTNNFSLSVLPLVQGSRCRGTSLSETGLRRHVAPCCRGPPEFGSRRLSDSVPNARSSTALRWKVGDRLHLF